MKIRLAFALIAAAGLIASAAAPGAVQRADEDDLTRELAQLRKSQVRSVDYELQLELHEGSGGFSGKAALDVALARTDAPLSIDFVWKQIEAVRVNGEPLADPVTRKGSLDIPAQRLRAQTRIEIDYRGAFDTDGQGVQRTVDPQDGAEYVYTDFEAYYAHHLFPCFDQPDLKASYRLSVEAPAAWSVISNEIAESTTSAADGRALTRFPRSKRFSTYLFFVGAGPFVEWKADHGATPLRLYARKSTAAYVDAPALFATIGKGLGFYEDYFATPYPFAKFALVFVPEFAWGGMENPGAITVNERYLFRGPVPRSVVDDRDSLILHEMAHMWFGDLVTMAWWSDLWLNESFASYVSSLAQDRALKTASAWLDFFGQKGWGYWQDLLVTTHPIETDVADVRTAKGNFDGITYAKGAAALKQLHFYVGEAGFRDGLRRYFAKFAFQNTTRADFIGEIANASGVDLGAWTKAWLQTAGPNRVRTEWSCEAGAIASFRVLQAPSSSGTLSPHRTRVGLYRIAPDRSLELVQSQDVSYSARETAVAELNGAPCPDFVHANLGDEDYALFALDRVSLRSARLALVGGLADPLARLMVWHALAQMVRDAELPVMGYFDLALAGFEREADAELLGNLIGSQSPPLAYYYGYLTQPVRLALAPRFEAVIWKRVAAAPAGSSLQMTFFDYYAQIAQTPEALARVEGFLDARGVPDGITIDQDRRWALLGVLAAAGRGSALERIDAEGKRDPTTTGTQNAYGARAAFPDLASKRRFWSDFHTADRIPFTSLLEAAASFHQPNHPELSEPFVEPFFADAAAIDWKANDKLVEIFLERLFPRTLCTRALLEQSRARLASAANLIPIARRAWLEANDELATCIAVRERAGL